MPQQEPLCSRMTGSLSTPCKAPQHDRRTDKDVWGLFHLTRSSHSYHPVIQNAKPRPQKRIHSRLSLHALWWSRSESRETGEGKKGRLANYPKLHFQPLNMGGGTVSITFSVNSQVLIDIYIGNWGFSLSFKPKLTLHTPLPYMDLLSKQQRRSWSM